MSPWMSLMKLWWFFFYSDVIRTCFWRTVVHLELDLVLL
jgi:hypothetical protein